MAQIQAGRYITLLLVAAAALHITNYIYYSIYVSEQPTAFAYIVAKNTDGPSKFYKRVKQIASSLPSEDQTAKQPTIYFNNAEESSDPSYETPHQIATSSEKERESYRTDELPTTKNITMANSRTGTGMPVLDVNYFKTKEYWVQWCPVNPPNLGPIVKVTKVGSTDTVPLFMEIKPGGQYKPRECLARQKVAVIVAYPYLDQYVRLATFLYAIHPFLVKQMLDYRIFVVEQVNETILSMSPGTLMNIGFDVAQRERPDWDCFVFHVPELLPRDSRNLYTCDPRGPKQLVTWIGPHRYHDETFTFPNETMLITIGGVMAMTPDQFKAVNGFSNILWERSGEYEDMLNRIRAARMRLQRSYPDFAKYGEIDSSLPLRRRFDIPEAENLTAAPHYQREGLSTLSYAHLTTELAFLYTMISVDESSNLPKDKRNEPSNGVKGAVQEPISSSKKVIFE